MKKLLIMLLCVLFLFSGCSNKSESKDLTTVTVDSGSIRGKYENEIVVFKGVPFAKPPVGELRFAPAQPADPWEGVLECTEFKSIPPQINSGNVEGDEDCLYLNIWAPEDALKGEKKYPVFVYIHGGAFAVGFASDWKYDGSELAKDGVICVTVEYRLNALGFITDEEMEKHTGYASNLGILDQIEALKWIKNNIGNFGGDSENVTVSGESAGAMSVSSLIVSPLAKGLFNKAVLESGSIFSTPIFDPLSSGSKEKALLLGKKFYENVNAKNMTELKNTDVNTLVKQSAFSIDVTKPNECFFMPVFDGKVIAENPYESMKDGKCNDVSILIGYNTDEGSMFVPKDITIDAYEKFVHRIFKEDAQAVLDRYPVNEKYSASDRARYIVKMAFMIGCNIMGDALSDRGYDVYIYNFDYQAQSSLNEGLGVMHGLELLFVFGTLTEDMKHLDNAEKFSSEVRAYWTSFAKTGNPNGDNRVSWPKYTEKNKKILQLSADTKEIDMQDIEDVEFFIKLLWAD